MKKAFIAISVLLVACAQLKQGQMQPVIPEAEGAYFTTCSGTVEDWGSCHRKAKNVCKNGYEVLYKNENPVGGRRELRFACTK